ncbi:MAG: Smr/MutS family protein [Lentisphaerales bacterium]|nr:Smr/MutS family protein [Lentisphaerales bacterium]
MAICEMCGEPIDSNVCPFCETEQGLESEINIPDFKPHKPVKLDSSLLAAINPDQRIPKTNCEMCGEPIDRLQCPFCNTVQGTQPKVKTKTKRRVMKVVNIKDDLPVVDIAIARMEIQIDEAREEEYRALKIIHGYGSSGKGGAIKNEIHRVLRRMYLNEQIFDWIPGEEFSAEYEETLELLRKFQFLENDEDFRQYNRGISIIIL